MEDYNLKEGEPDNDINCNQNKEATNNNNELEQTKQKQELNRRTTSNIKFTKISY